MADKTLKSKKYWKPYYKRMSNETLKQNIKDHKTYSSEYRGTVLPKVAREELERRKKAGLIRSDAGTTKRRRSSGGSSNIFGNSGIKLFGVRL